MNTPLICASATLLALSPHPAHASTHDLQAVDAAVANFTGKAVTEVGGAMQPVDQRFRLASCAAPLALSWYGRLQSAVEVRCPVPGGWRIFVPVVMPDRSSGNAGKGGPAKIGVERGDLVALTIEGEDFAITRQVEVLESGAVGAWVRVKADSQTGSLRAKVTGAGEVGILLPRDRQKLAAGP